MRVPKSDLGEAGSARIQAPQNHFLALEITFWGTKTGPPKSLFGFPKSLSKMNPVILQSDFEGIPQDPPKSLFGVINHSKK